MSASKSLRPIVKETLAGIPHSARVGVMVSGGFDSSLLLYYLLREMGSVRLKVFTVPRPDDAFKHAGRMASVACELANCNTLRPIAVGNPQLHHSLQTFSGILQVLREDWVDFLFVAENRIPEDPSLRDDPWAPGRFRTRYKRVLHPFFDLTKDQLISSAYADELERLLVESHTCTEQKDGRCGRCWQCRERLWAFQRLDRVDPGTL